MSKLPYLEQKGNSGLVKSWNGVFIRDYKINLIRGGQKAQRLKEREAGRL